MKLYIKSVTLKPRIWSWLIAIVAFLALASCGKEDVSLGEVIFEGKHPLILASTMDELKTRATTNNTWTGDEKIALNVDNEGVKQYTVSRSGFLTASIGVTPFFWENSKETKNISAWFPYTESQPTTFSVYADQSDKGYQFSDMLYAGYKEITFPNASSTSLIFKHLPVQIIVNLKNGNGVSEEEVKNATIQIVSQNLQSNTINYIKGEVEIAQEGSSVIIPNNIIIANSGYVRSEQALLVPQQMMGKKFIKVTIGNSDFYYTPVKENEAKFTTGNSYAYNIIVKSNGLYVTTSGVTWEDGGSEEVESEEVTISTNTECEVYDHT